MRRSSLFLLSSFLFSTESIIDYNSKLSVKDQVAKIIRNGSGKMHYPMGVMPPMMAKEENIDSISSYIANGAKGEEPPEMDICKACHGQDLKGKSGMTPNISNIGTPKDECSKEKINEYLQIIDQPIKEFGDEARVISFGNKACNCNSAAGCKNLGIRKLFKKGIKEDIPGGFELLQKACDLNDGESCFNLGMLKIRGFSDKADIEGGFPLVEKSCELNYGKGCHTLGSIIYRGMFNQKVDKKKGLDLVKKACDLKYKPACEDIKILEFEKKFTPEQIKILAEAYKKVKEDINK